MEFKPGDEVIYQQAHKGADMEFGIVKRKNNTGTGYFVWYHTDDTAANTPAELLRAPGTGEVGKVKNTYAVSVLRERAKWARHPLNLPENEKYGLEEDTFVATGGMLELVSEEHTKEDVEIIARIIARADDAEDRIDELEGQLADKHDRDSAVAALMNSDYAKLYAWMVKLPRLSKKARREFMEILNGSSALKFHNFELIKDEIGELLDA